MTIHRESNQKVLTEENLVGRDGKMEEMEDGRHENVWDFFQAVVTRLGWEKT